MSSPQERELHAEHLAEEMQPESRGEFVTSVAHYYRAELTRMITWRDRLDHTTNWAIAATAAMLSVSLSSPTSHHAVILCCMALVFLLLLIETRRYRFFDISRRRARLLERNYYARVFDEEAGEEDNGWETLLSQNLRLPRFGVTAIRAMRNRIRRNYIWIYLPLFLSWWLKVSTNVLNASQGEAEFVRSSAELFRNAKVAYIPGQVVVGGVMLFLLWLVLMAWAHRIEADGGGSVEADV